MAALQRKKILVGWKTVREKIPVYGQKRVLVGFKKVSVRVPRWVRRRVFAGWDEIRTRVPRYVDRYRRVVSHVRHKVATFVKRIVWLPKVVSKLVPRFIERTRRVVTRVVHTVVRHVVSVVRKVENKVEEVTKPIFGFFGKVIGWFKKKVVRPVVRRVRKEIKIVSKWVEEKVRYVKEKVLAGWEWVKSRVWVPVKRRLFAGYRWVRKRVVKWVHDRVKAGWQYVTRRVPKYVTRMVRDGWSYVTRTVPQYVTRKVQVGWRVVKKKVPVYVGLGTAAGALAELLRKSRALRGAGGGAHLLNTPVRSGGGVEDLIEAERRTQEILRQEGASADTSFVPGVSNPLVRLGGALGRLASFSKDMARGFLVDGVFDSVKDTFGLLKTVATTAMNPLQVLKPALVGFRVGRTVGGWIKEGTFTKHTRTIVRWWWDRQVGWYKRVWKSPRYGRAVGKALFEALMIYFLVVGGYEAVKGLSDLRALDFSQAVTRADDVSKVARAAEHVDEAEEAIRAAGHLGEGVHAVLTASLLRAEGLHSEEGARLVKALAEQSTHGSGSRVVLGKWVAGGGYIAEAKAHGGIYFETAEGVWEALGKNEELVWAVNEQFLRNQLEAGVSRIELVGETIEEVLTKRPKSFTAKEIEFLKQNAWKYGYELQGNAWVKVR